MEGDSDSDSDYDAMRAFECERKLMRERRRRAYRGIPRVSPERVPRAYRRPPPGERPAIMKIILSLTCNSCGNFMPKSTAVRCDVVALPLSRLGCPKYRAYLSCTKCSAEMIIERNDESTDYFVVSGATRYFPPEEQRSEVSEEVPESLMALTTSSVNCDSQDSSDCVDAMDADASSAAASSKTFLQNVTSQKE